MALTAVLKACFMASMAVIGVPYTVAIICNFIYGWPPTEDKLRKALAPRRVLKMNYAFLQQLTLLRFTKLFCQNKYYYWRAGSDVLIKDIKYGSNGNKLDLHVPDHCTPDQSMPVVVFVYGGTWGSGDKSTYARLANNVSNRLNTITCCPNYSIYPKGHVDDMVQDIVDCIEWIQNNIVLYGGEKDNILLMGHSAGAHLCVMAVFELLTKQSLQGPPLPVSSIVQSMRFIDADFYESNGGEAEQKAGVSLADSCASAGSFVVLDTSRADRQLRAAIQEKRNGSDEESSMAPTDRELPPSMQSMEGSDMSYVVVSSEVPTSQSLGNSSSSIELVRNGDDAEEEKEEEDGARARRRSSESQNGDEVGSRLQAQASDSVQSTNLVTTHTTPKPRRRGLDPNRKMSKNQLEIYSLLSSIRGVIGLCGVYHIGDHYKFECARGVEDLSVMTRAMYGMDYFDRFSPTVIADKLPSFPGLPPFVLVHAVNDTTVPYTSTTTFAQTLGHSRLDLVVRLLPAGGHIDLCADLMDSKRMFHNVIMDIIQQTAVRVLY